MVDFFNIFYFMFILICVGFIIGFYFLLRKRSYKTKKVVVFSLLAFNLILHFVRFYILTASGTPYISALRDTWFTNICAVSVLTFPFFFISKSNALKDFVFYLGVISGGLAMLIPTEAIGVSLSSPDLYRFYLCHIIIIAAPLLMVLLKVHTLDYKRIWKMPFIISGFLLFIICNQVLQSELGIIDLRSDDFFNPNYRNPSLIWGPTDDLAVLFTWLTPDFFKIVPVGEFAGQIKYWPFFYLLPAIFFYFLIIPFLLCLPWQAKVIKNDIKKFFGFFRKKRNT